MIPIFLSPLQKWKLVELLFLGYLSFRTKFEQDIIFRKSNFLWNFPYLTKYFPPHCWTSYSKLPINEEHFSIYESQWKFLISLSKIGFVMTGSLINTKCMQVCWIFFTGFEIWSPSWHQKQLMSFYFFSNNVRLAATNALLNSLEFTKANFDKEVRETIFGGHLNFFKSVTLFTCNVYSLKHIGDVFLFDVPFLFMNWKTKLIDHLFYAHQEK